MNINEAKVLLEKYGNLQVLAHFDELNENEKTELLSQIEKIDFERLKVLYQKAVSPVTDSVGEIEPIKAVKKSSVENNEEIVSLGEKSIKEGKLAFVTMAGGQGTRLGFNGPKGAYVLDIENNKSLFELLCDTLKEAKNKYGVTIPWYIMTSRENNRDTVAFFEQNNYFNYGKDNVFFCIQGELPMLFTDGTCVMESKSKIREAADGHGGVFTALSTSGAVQDMVARGIKWVFIGGVDNPLLKMVDPLFIGLCEEKNYMLGSKTIIKRSPDEKVGVFCKRDGKPYVVEYTEISEEMANLRDENGELVFGQSHILCNMFNIEFLKSLENEPLPYHTAHKKTSYMDSTGKICTPDAPNAYKFESFIFDAFSKAEDVLLLETLREDEFAPVKNNAGEDSPETARKLLKEYRERINSK